MPAATEPDQPAAKPPYTFKWYERIAVALGPPLAALLMKLLCLTCRVVAEEGREKDEATYAEYGGRIVYCTWHQRMFYFFHTFGRWHVTMMISKSKDGEYAARVAHWLGFKSVRGSSSRGGSGAWKELVRRVREDGERAGMLTDGPKGPGHVAKLGTVLIARDTGVPIIPMMYGVDRCWTARSWDRYIVVKPFAKVSIVHGDPIHVPPDIEGEELERYRQILEDAMNAACRRADELIGVDRMHFGGEKK